jgi:PTS system mannose-specific IIA component
MIGIVICTHGSFGKDMLGTAQAILGPQEGVESLSLPPELGREDLEEALRAALPRLDQGQGVLVLVDLLGGTPCNAALRCRQGSYEILAGVSLPVLLEALLKRGSLPLDQLAAELVEHGRQSLMRVDPASLRRTSGGGR